MAFWMALLVAVPASGLDGLLYFCNMTGEVGQKCGCPHEPGPSMAKMSISSAPCCERISSNDLVPPTRAEVLSLEHQGADVMKRIAAPMVGGLSTSFLLELTVYPAVFAIWKSRTLDLNED